MATKTTADLCDRVSALLNQLRPGQSVSARNAAIISDSYETTLAELVDLGAAYWTKDEIPVAVFNRLALLIALDCATYFGALPIILQAIGAQNQHEAREQCIYSLRRHVEIEPDYEMQHETSDWM